MLRLNEGFASYMEYRGCASYETGWDTASWFLFKDLYPVLDLDATIGSHAIVVDVNTPDEVITTGMLTYIEIGIKCNTGLT